MEDIKCPLLWMSMHGLMRARVLTSQCLYTCMASDGQFDALEFPFKGTVTINQLENNNYHHKSINIKQTLIVKARALINSFLTET